MKIYRTNKEAVRAYLNNPFHGGGRAGNIFFEGGILYSYGKHFPLAGAGEDGEIISFSAAGQVD